MDKQQQILTWASAFVLGISLGRWFRQWRDNCKERFHSVTARACQWTAALRAVESLEIDGALFRDELAASLAGKKVFSQALREAKPVQKDAQVGEPGKRLYMITEVAIGTWWFDREIINALTSPAISSTRGWLSARLRNSARGAMGPPRQVVVLGAGLDTRPWRLPLPKLVKWLEVDNSEVVQAKRHRLECLNVQMEPVEHVGFHPLRCSEWYLHAADLSCGQDWGSILSEYGFDASMPIVWVIEGVLMYLSQESVHEVLQDLAKVSCAGSTLIGSSTVNRNAELFGGNDHDVACGSYQAEAVDEWISSLPQDPSIPLLEAGWSLTNASLLTEMAQDVCKGDPVGKCNFETELQIDDRPTEVYFVAKKK